MRSARARSARRTRLGALGAAGVLGASGQLAHSLGARLAHSGRRTWLGGRLARRTSAQRDALGSARTRTRQLETRVAVRQRPAAQDSATTAALTPQLTSMDAGSRGPVVDMRQRDKRGGAAAVGVGVRMTRGASAAFTGRDSAHASELWGEAGRGAPPERPLGRSGHAPRRGCRANGALKGACRDRANADARALGEVGSAMARRACGKRRGALAMASRRAVSALGDGTSVRSSPSASAAEGRCRRHAMGRRFQGAPIPACAPSS